MVCDELIVQRDDRYTTISVRWSGVNGQGVNHIALHNDQVPKLIAELSRIDHSPSEDSAR